MKLYYLSATAILLVALLVALLFSVQGLQPYSEILIDKVSSVLSYMLEQLLSLAKLEYLLILFACFVLDAIFLGKNKSALSNILKPDNSTKNDIYIFIIGLSGLRHYFIMFSFLLVGYFSRQWADVNMSFDLIRNVDSVIIQMCIYIIIYDFLDYWIHRCAHRVSWWWEVHRFHHSATKFNIITVGRTHPLDLALADFLLIIPMTLLGTPIEQLFVIVVLRSMLGKLQHSMIGWDFGWLGRYIIMSPVGHRIHHSPYPEHWDKHYAHTFIFWDRMFGTYYDGDFVNDRVGLSNTTDNQKGLVYDIVMGQWNFFKAFFFKKWSFSEGVMTKEDVKNYIDSHPHVERPESKS
mgnify:CR=1 FL=1